MLLRPPLQDTQLLLPGRTIVPSIGRHSFGLYGREEWAGSFPSIWVWGFTNVVVFIYIDLFPSSFPLVFLPSPPFPSLSLQSPQRSHLAEDPSFQLLFYSKSDMAEASSLILQRSPHPLVYVSDADSFPLRIASHNVQGLNSPVK